MSMSHIGGGVIGYFSNIDINTLLIIIILGAG